MNASNPEKIVPSIKSTFVLRSETGSDVSDNEFDGYFFSATFDSRRNKILPDTKLDKKLSRKDYSGKPKNLAVKIDKGVNGKPVTASSYSNEIISSNVENGQDFNILSVKSTNDTYFEQLTKKALRNVSLSKSMTFRGLSDYGSRKVS
uniref:Serine-type D-Ala-D-Ala carboxypeptidase n=1 Tax=Loa loa TaxID=7209 RepID=A0A1I7VDN3_LOALO